MNLLLARVRRNGANLIDAIHGRHQHLQPGQEPRRDPRGGRSHPDQPVMGSAGRRQPLDRRHGSRGGSPRAWLSGRVALRLRACSREVRRDEHRRGRRAWRDHRGDRRRRRRGSRMARGCGSRAGEPAVRLRRRSGHAALAAGGAGPGSTFRRRLSRRSSRCSTTERPCGNSASASAGRSASTSPTAGRLSRKQASSIRPSDARRERCAARRSANGTCAHAPPAAAASTCRTCACNTASNRSVSSASISVAGTTGTASAAPASTIATGSIPRSRRRRATIARSLPSSVCRAGCSPRRWRPSAAASGADCADRRHARSSTSYGCVSSRAWRGSASASRLKALARA